MVWPARRTSAANASCSNGPGGGSMMTAALAPLPEVLRSPIRPGGVIASVNGGIATLRGGAAASADGGERDQAPAGGTHRNLRHHSLTAGTAAHQIAPARGGSGDGNVYLDRRR